MHWETSLCNRTHPTCNLVKSITRFTGKHTLRGDIHSFLGMFPEKTMGFWLSLSQTVDILIPAATTLPVSVPMSFIWVPDDREWTGHRRASFMLRRLSWNPRRPAGLCWIRQIFSYTVLYKCLYQTFAL